MLGIPSMSKLPLLPNERWVDCGPINYPNYMMSSLGRCWGKILERLLEGSLIAGYHVYALSIQGKKIKVPAHVMVAEAFLDAPLPGQTQVDHIDRIRNNNKQENLHWVTPAEQARNRTVTKTRHGVGVYKYDQTNTFLKGYRSKAHAVQKEKFSKFLLERALDEGTLYNGHYWKYKTKVDTPEGEEWRIVPKFRGIVYASSHGRIKVRDVIVNGMLDPAGYLMVGIFFDGKALNYRVHRLVAEAFFGPSELLVNHKDTKKSNNHYTNLEYATSKENVEHAHRMGLIDKTKLNQKRRRVVIQMDMQGNEIARFSHAKGAELAIGVDDSTICQACNGKAIQAGGFKWKYA